MFMHFSSLWGANDLFSMKIMNQPIRADFATIGWKSSIFNFDLLRCKKFCDWSIKNWHQRTSWGPIGCLKYIQHTHAGHLHYFIGLAQFRSGPFPWEHVKLDKLVLFFWQNTIVNEVSSDVLMEKKIMRCNQNHKISP